MNQLGGVGAGGIPGRSYAFAPGADGVSRNLSICGNSYCKELHNITLTNEEFLFFVYIITNNSTGYNNYIMNDFYSFSSNLVKKLEIYKNLYLRKSNTKNMDLNQFYNFPRDYDNSGIITTKIINDNSYIYNKSAIEIINTYTNRNLINIPEPSNKTIELFWKEIFRYLHWYICK